MYVFGDRGSRGGHRPRADGSFVVDPSPDARSGPPASAFGMPEDQPRPFHAKQEATGQEAADAVAAVLKHAAARDEAAHKKAPAKPQPKWMLPLGINLAVFAAYLLVFSPEWAIVRPIEGPPVAERTEMLRSGMWIKAGLIEAYRDANGRLPETLAEVPGPALEGVEYTRQGEDFLLVGLVGEEQVVYDSAQPSEEFEQAAGTRLGQAGVG